MGVQFANGRTRIDPQHLKKFKEIELILYQAILLMPKEYHIWREPLEQVHHEIETALKISGENES